MGEEKQVLVFLTYFIGECGHVKMSKKHAKRKTSRCTTEHQQTFEKMKQCIAFNIVLAHPKLKLLFGTCIDVSDYQLGLINIQNNIPIAFFSRKLCNAKKI